MKRKPITKDIELKQWVEDVFARYEGKRSILYKRADGSLHSYTYGGLRAGRDALAQRMRPLLRPGDRVALIGPFSPAWTMAYAAVLLLDATAVLLDPALPAQELRGLLAETEARVIFCAGDTYEGICRESLAGVPAFALEDGFAPLCAAAERPEGASTDADPEVHVIIYSSGTTARMKGVQLTRAGVSRGVQFCNWLYPHPTGRRRAKYLNILPPCHIAGFMFTRYLFMHGIECYFMEKLVVANVSGEFQAYKPAVFCAVPKVYEVFHEKIEQALAEKGALARAAIHGLLGFCGLVRRLTGLRLGFWLLRSINRQAFGGNARSFCSGAASIKPETAAFFYKLGIDFVHIYALTEAGVPVAATFAESYLPGTSGYVMDASMGVNPALKLSVRIQEPDKNGVGEIQIKTPLIMKGYFKDPEGTSAAFTGDGFFKTGDLGYFNGRGALCVCGRIKETILMHTGKKVSPTDLEAHYNGIPGIQSLACCGVPVAGEPYDEPYLFVVPEPGGKQPDAEIRQSVYLRSNQLPPHYRISHVEILPELPVTSLMKVKRHVLRQQAVSHRPREAARAAGPRDVRGEIIRLACEYSGMQASAFQMEAALHMPFNMDSLALTQLLVEAETFFGVSLCGMAQPPNTVERLVEVIHAQQAGEGEAGMPLYDVPRFPLRCSRLDRLALRATLALSKWIWPAAVTGTEHIPGHDRYIVCPNHETVMDNFWVLRHLPAAHRPKVFAVFKQEHLQTGRGRYFSRLLNGVPIDRAGNSLPTLSRCEELLRQNRILMVFPEGTRTRTGTLQSFKTGAARLAITTGKLLLPVRIEGGFDAWPFGQKASFLRGRSLRVAFGAPIDPSGKTEEEVTDALRQAVASL